MILAVVVLASALILAVSAVHSRRRKRHSGPENAELSLFDTMREEPVAAQLRQLAKAARLNLDAKQAVERRMPTIAALHEEGLVSDGYYSAHLRQEEELAVEKIIIEGEAEALRPGAKDTIFAEASRLPAAEKPAKKKRLFDEALYLKKHELFMNKMSPRAAAGGA